MSSSNVVKVMVDDRLRLMSAALAATSFPQKAQERKRHHAHSHARGLVKHLQEIEMHRHPAIITLQGLLDQGAPIEALFTLVMYLPWPGLDSPRLPDWVPPNWNNDLWSFYEEADLERQFKMNATAWEKARSEAEHVFIDVNFRELLESFVGPIEEELVFAPNLLWPADRPIGLRVGKQLISLVPPPLAWGESPPWPFDEETRLGEHTYPAALSQYARLLMLAYLRANAAAITDATEKDLPVNDELKLQYPTWEDQFIALFQSAIVAIYLEDYVSDLDAKGYMLMEKRVRHMTELPGTVSVLRRYLQEKGNRYNTLAEFLSVFPTQLRVAKKIVTL